MAGVLRIPVGPDGQYHLWAKVNGFRVHFLVDTGASDVALNAADARRIGFDIKKLYYDRVFTTANGTTRGASVVLADFSIGSLRFNQHPASVNEGELEESLMGMGFLSRASSIEIKNGVMTLRWQN